MQSGPHKKPRGRPPKGKTWDPHQGEYVEPRVPSPPAPIDRTRSISTQSNSQSWNSEDMMDSLTFRVGRKQNPYRECTRNMRDSSGQYAFGFYNPKTRNTVANPVHIRRSISDQGTRVFIRGLEERPEPLYQNFRTTSNGPAEATPFLDHFHGEMRSWYESKTPDQQNYLNSSDDARILVRVMMNALDNYMSLSGHGDFKP